MKIKKVTKLKLEEKIPVYDLTVNETHNFALGNGIFVHNSKDISDAICGACFSAITDPVIKSRITTKSLTEEEVDGVLVKKLNEIELTDFGEQYEELTEDMLYTGIDKDV